MVGLGGLWRRGPQIVVQHADFVPGSGTVANQKISPKGSATDPDLMLDFSSLLVDNYVAVQMTISVVGSANDGWLTVWGDGPFPGAVSVNFLAGRVIGGFTHSELTGVFSDSTEPFGHLKIKVTHPVSVTIDVVGFITPDVRTLFKSHAAASMAPATPSRVPKVAPRKKR